MQALILAGGQGTRLKPYTAVLPKALVPLGDIPVLELVLRQLKYYGFTQITLAVGHLAELIEAFFGDGRKWGIEITYLREEQPLGTAGPIRTIADLPENFLVLNADIICDMDYRAFFEAHVASKSHASIAVYQRTTKIDFGVLDYDPKTLQIQEFIEKPVLEHTVSMGIYAFRQNVKDFIPPKQLFGFDQLMLSLLEHQKPISAYPVEGYWLDIGRLDDYERALEDFKTQKYHLLPDLKPEPSAVTP